MGFRWRDTLKVDVLPHLVDVDAHNLKAPVALSLYDETNPVSATLDQATGLVFKESDLNVQEISTEALVKLGFNTAVDVLSRTTTKTFVRVWNLIHHTAGQEPVPNPQYANGSAIKSARWGIGVRIVIVGWEIKENLKITNPAGLAAQVQLGNAGSMFDIQLLGADRKTLKLLTPLLATGSSKYTEDVHQKVVAARAALTNHFEDHSLHPELVPALLNVELDTHRLGNRPGPMPLEAILASENLVLEQIDRGRSCAAALEHERFARYQLFGEFVDRDLITQAYADVCKLGPSDRPGARLRETVQRRLKQAGGW